MYQEANINEILNLWDEMGLHASFNDYPNPYSVQIWRNFSLDELKGALLIFIKTRDAGKIRTSENILESSCRYITGIMRNRREGIRNIQAAIDARESEQAASNG